MARKIVNVFAVLMILCGLGFLLYPKATAWVSEQQSEKVIQEFEDSMAQISGEEEAENTDADEDEALILSEDMNRLHGDMQAYNERIYQEGQVNLRDPFSYELPSFDLTEYGLNENVIGSVWIPRMNVKLPVYLGATNENMAKGAVVLGETSMLIGGVNTNVVLAAHRGWKGTDMFRNIQAIQLGDKIQITTPWGKLIYRVTELKIILPNDSQEILIQEGKDMVTLLTCHPYTQNYQRYLVRAERSAEKPKSEKEDLEEAGITYNAEPREVQVDEGEETLITKVDPGSIQPSFREGTGESGAQYSNLQIWLETYGVPIGIVIGVILIAIVWVTSRRNI